MKFNFAVFMGYSLEIYGIFIHMSFIVVAFNKPWKNFPGSLSHAKGVHMHVKNFTYIASNMHVNFKFHVHDKIVSHVWKDFTWNKMHGKKVHTYDQNFPHVLQNFTCMSKSSHACEMLMWWTCILPTLISHGSFFSQTFHTLFTWFSHT